MAPPEEETIVIFPFMAQGHIIPFLALATQLQRITRYKIIIVNTPLNINKLRSSLPPTNDNSIHLKELPFCSINHGLPPDSESTDVLPYDLMIRLFEASLSLKSSFHQLILDITEQQNGKRPVCIISDMFLGWTAEVAKDFDIYHSLFITSNAYSMAIYYSIWIHLPHTKTSSPDFSLPDFPQVSTLHRSQLPSNVKNANGSDAWSVFIQQVIRQWWQSDALLLSTMEELDGIGLQYFREKMGGRPVWSILPSLCNSSLSRPDKKSGIELEHCLDWLDNHPPASVLFVSFGSQNTITSSQLMELAIALEASGNNFIWVIRPPIGFDINGEFRSEWLPEGFEERIQNEKRGLMVRKWAPQLEILSHKSTGAFLSHCGWNSVLESLSNGVPIIGWPLSGEQFYNSKMLEEELGVCIEVARGNTMMVNEIKNEDIKSVIELVMGGSQKGEEMKRKAGEVKRIIKDAIREEEGFKGSSVIATEEFLAAVKTKSNKRTNKVWSRTGEV